MIEFAILQLCCNQHGILFEHTRNPIQSATYSQNSGFQLYLYSYTKYTNLHVKNGHAAQVI